MGELKSNCSMKDKEKSDKGGGGAGVNTPVQGNGPGPNPTYVRWLLEAVRKIKHQKQRPCLDRIQLAVKHLHGEANFETIKEQLELAVQAGKILCVCNKGVFSYRDPTRVSTVTGHPTRTLRVNRKSDLTKIIIKSIGELGNKEGTSLKNVEKYIRRSYQLELDDNLDLTHQLRISAKRAITSHRLVHEGRIYRVPDGASSVDSTPPERAKLEPEPPEEETIVDMAVKKSQHKVRWEMFVHFPIWKRCTEIGADGCAVNGSHEIPVQCAL